MLGWFSRKKSQAARDKFLAEQRLAWPERPIARPDLRIHKVGFGERIMRPVQSIAPELTANLFLDLHFDGWRISRRESMGLNYAPVMQHVANKVLADRKALVAMLTSDKDGPQNFGEQQRLLAEYQAGVSTLDIINNQMAQHPGMTGQPATPAQTSPVDVAKLEQELIGAQSATLAAGSLG